MFVFKKKIAMFARPSFSEVRAASRPPADWCAASRIALVDMRLASLGIVLEQSGTFGRRDVTGAGVRA
ncbi:hypothetical protein GALL_282680 [mine drainage metagenome]|uniref:Uncharacterized protein n=1 Tax=mine drainage metagenome TaxID=410659 RepID=A0A1J5R1K8_9ZZZZ